MLPTFESLQRLQFDTSEKVLLIFAFALMLLGLLAVTGLLARIVRTAVGLLNALLLGGFGLWRRFFSRLHWSLLLTLILLVQAFGWLGREPFPFAALLTGVFLLVVGVTACMAYVVIDQERYEVTRGYKVLHNPGKGQEVADQLLRHGSQVGLPLLLAACLATLTGFTLFNLGMYDLLGDAWCVPSQERHSIPAEQLVRSPRAAAGQLDYADFLAYSLLHLISALDLIDLINQARVAEIAYVHPVNPAARLGQTLFRVIFTAVLLRQLFAWYRDRRLLTDTVRDFWSSAEPIQRRACEMLAQQGGAAAQALLRSISTTNRMTPAQQALLPEVLAAAGPSVMPLLVRNLRNSRVAVREAAIAALGRLQAIEALPDLEKAADDPSESVREGVANALGEVFASGPAAARKRWKLRRPQVAKRGWLPPRAAGADNADPVERAAVALRRLASDRARAVRLAALDALRQLGPEVALALEGLIHLAADEDEGVRERVAAALGEARGEADRIVPPLMRLLEDSTPAVRLAAARAVGGLGGEAAAAVPVLLLLVQDANDDVRQAAAAALADVGTLDARALPRLTAGLRSQDNLVQARAAEAIGSIGPAAAVAVPALIALLNDDSDRVRQRTVWALGEMGDAAAVPALGAALNDPDFRVAAEAAAALGRLGPAATPATDALVRAAGHMNPLVRRNVAAALVGDDPDRVVPTLLLLADDPEQEVRLAAISSLGHFPQQAARDPVRAALADDDPAIRLAAVRALSTNGESLEELTPILLPLLNDPSEGVVVEVVATLGRVDDLPDVVTRRLEGLLQRDAEAVQLAAVQVLGQFAPAARRATPGLLRALERGPAAVREQALRVLLQTETPDLTGAYLAALHDSEVGVRRLAAAGLILSAPLPAETLPALAEGMKDPDAQVRSNLAMVLAKQEQLPLGVIPTLLRCLEEPDDGLRLNALRALQNDPERLTEVLPRLLADPNGQVAFLAASTALRRDPRNARAGAILLRALSSETVRDRRQAVEVLEQLGAEGVRFAEAVRRQVALETDAELREAMLGLPALVVAAEPS